MPKVITGAGLQEFIESGKHENIAPNKKAESKEAPPLEVKKETPVIDVKPLDEPKAEVKPEEDGLEPEDKDLSEIIRKKIGKKHRAMKEAQEAAADAESFAKAQFDERRLIEGERDRLKRELEEAKKATPAPKAEEKDPDIKDFTDDKGQVRWTDYTKAVADHSAKKAVNEERSRQQQEALKAQQERIAAELAEERERFKEKADQIPNFKERLDKAKIWLPDAVLEYITLSDDGPEIAMHFVDNPETADRISKLRPIKAIAAIEKLVKDFGKAKEPEKAEAKPVIQERGGAPPPITPISGMGSGTINTDPAKMSTKELRAYEAERYRHKHRY